MKVMQSTISFIFIFFAFFLTNDVLASADGTQGIRILCDTPEKLNLLRSLDGEPGFDITQWGPRVEALVAPDKLESFKAELEASDALYEVFTEDVFKVVRDSLAQQKKARMRIDARSGGISLKYFPRYHEIENYLSKLARTHSDIVSLFSIGKSYEKRDVVGIKISSGGDIPKPALFIDAGIHAREWIAPTTALYAIKQLVENATNSYIYKDVDIYVIPSLNPDGYEYTHINESRKTRSQVPNSKCLGADPNRNFDIEWMSFGGSSDPCSNTFAGTKPFSEPETAALRDFILALKDKIKVYLSLHSYGSYFLHPWGHTKHLPKNEPLLRCVAEKARKKLYEVRGTEYTIGSSANLNAFTAGNSKDWAMGKAGIEVSYTMELPRGFGFAPPPSEIEPTGRESFEAIKVLARYVDNNICQHA